MNIANGTFSGRHRIHLITETNHERRSFCGLLETSAKIDQHTIGFRPLVETVNLELCLR